MRQGKIGQGTSLNVYCQKLSHV